MEGMEEMVSLLWDFCTILMNMGTVEFGGGLDSLKEPSQPW
jgi:hypothetical protein